MDTIENRDKISVTIFNDEFNKLEINDDMNLFQAQTQIRSLLHLEARQQRGNPRSKARRLIQNADAEKLSQVIEVLEA